MNTDILCRDPWNTLFIGTYNEARTCCAGETILGDLNRQNLTEILNSKTAKQIRTDMANGIWPKNCSQCRQLEQQGARSYRNSNLTPELKELIDLDPTDYLIETLDFRWNNSCTLACNYCDEKFSSAWAVLKKIDIGTDRSYYDFALDWVKEHRTDIKKIYMLGGEPLIIKENAKILETLKGQDVEIILGTSLNVNLDSPVFEQLKNFPRVYIDISFENVESRYEYVRHNGSWDLLLKNINLVKQIPEFTLCSLPIYNIYSALDLYKYHEFLIDQEFAMCHWHRVHYPQELDVLNHSPDVRKLALDELYRTQDRFANSYIYDRVFFQNIIQLLENAAESGPSGMDQFTHKIENVYHKNKRHTFYELWPEFKNLIL